MFYSLLGSKTRSASVAQIDHEARVTRGKAAELGCGHSGAAQEDFDFSDQHHYPRGKNLDATRYAQLVAHEILLV